MSVPIRSYKYWQQFLLCTSIYQSYSHICLIVKPIIQLNHWNLHKSPGNWWFPMKFPSKTHGIGWMAPCLTSHHPGLNGLRKTRKSRLARTAKRRTCPLRMEFRGAEKGAVVHSPERHWHKVVYSLFLFGYKLYQVLYPSKNHQFYITRIQLFVRFTLQGGVLQLWEPAELNQLSIIWLRMGHHLAWDPRP